MKKNKTLKRTLTAILAATVIVSAGGYADTPLTATTVQAATKPAAVKNLRATNVTKNAFTVKWAKVKNAVRYNVRVWEGSKCLKNKNIKTNTLTMTGLKPDTRYTVKVINFTKVKKNGRLVQVTSAVATLKVKTKADPEAPSAPQEPSIDNTDTDEESIKWVNVKFGSETVAMTKSYYEAHHTAYDEWRDNFINNCITADMTDIEKCAYAGYYIDQRIDYDKRANPTGRSGAAWDPYRCYEKGFAVCHQSALILGDFLSHMGIESQYRTIPQKNHANLWAMIDGRAFIVDGTVSSVAGAPTFQMTTLPKHSEYRETKGSGTCRVTLMDGKTQTFTLEEAFPYGTTFPELRWEICDWYEIDKEKLEWFQSLPELEDDYKKIEAILSGDFSKW